MLIEAVTYGFCVTAEDSPHQKKSNVGTSREFWENSVGGPQSDFKNVRLVLRSIEFIDREIVG